MGQSQWAESLQDDGGGQQWQQGLSVSAAILGVYETIERESWRLTQDNANGRDNQRPHQELLQT